MSQHPRQLGRRAAPYLIAIGLIALVAWGFRPVPRLVDTEPVSRGHLEVTVEAEGRTRVIDRYEISAPIAAQVRRLDLEAGDPVAADQVLVTLDALPAPALDLRAVHQARARLLAATAALAAAEETAKAATAAATYARSELARLRPLARQDMVAATQLEQAEAETQRTEAELAAARFRVRVAAHERDGAAAELAYAGGQDPGASGTLMLRAPVAGRVLKRHIESTQVVQPGDPILEIGDPTRLEVEVDVLSADAVRLASGMRVWLERTGYPAPIEGRVQRIEPLAFTKVSALGVEEQRVWVIVAFVAPAGDWERLGDGYRVNARFVLWEHDDVLRLPTSGLFRDGAGWAVFAVEDRRARLRPVEIGQRGAIHTELRAGLPPGTPVILHPDREIRDGVRVQRWD